MSRAYCYSVNIYCPLPHCEGRGTARIRVEPEDRSGATEEWQPETRTVERWAMDCDCAGHRVVDTIAYAEAVEEEALARPQH